MVRSGRSSNTGRPSSRKRLLLAQFVPAAGTSSGHSRRAPNPAPTGRLTVASGRRICGLPLSTATASHAAGTLMFKPKEKSERSMSVTHGVGATGGSDVCFVIT